MCANARGLDLHRKEEGIFIEGLVGVAIREDLGNNYSLVWTMHMVTIRKACNYSLHVDLKY